MSLVDSGSNFAAHAPPGPPEEQPAHAAPEDPRRALGRLGEEIALGHMLARGFGLLERNCRTRHGEIDLIVCDRQTLVFVEVKTRRLGSPGRRSSGARAPDVDSKRRSPVPLEGLGVRQRARLRRLARAWLLDSPPQHRCPELRFDAIGVLVDERHALVRLDHVEGAW